MLHYRRSLLAIAIALAALAGFVDALAFTGLGGFFASFMSGNTTKLGVDIATTMTGAFWTAGALILAFVAGVMIAVIVARRFPDHRRVAVMTAVTGMLVLAAYLAGLTERRFPLLLLASAMGAENVAIHNDGDLSISLTYMTGTLVRMGEGITEALLGIGPAWAWLPYFLLWLGFTAGVIAGAALHADFRLLSLWIAAGAAAVLTVAIAVTVRAGDER